MPAAAPGEDPFDLLLTHVDGHRGLWGAVQVVGEADPCAYRHAQARLQPAHGAGRFAAHQFGRGLVLSALNGRLHRPYAAQEACPRTNFGINLMLSGRVRILSQRLGLHESSRRGEWWLRCGELGCVDSVMAAGDWRALALEVPQALLLRWCEEGLLGERNLAPVFLGHEPLFSVEPLNARMAPLVAALVHAEAACGNAARPATLFERLMLEGASLALLGHLLGAPHDGPAGARQHRSAIDEAVDILQAEHQKDITIAQLARRVGLNECYLKQGFRQKLGCTIGAFVRQKRMQHALALAESGHHTVAQIAAHVGYASVGHFARMFRAHHGFSVTQLRALRQELAPLVKR